MELSTVNGTTSNYFNVHDTAMPRQGNSRRTPVKKVLFDESHGELLRPEVTEESEADSCSELSELLFKQKYWEVVSHKASSESLTDELLVKHDVLVLGGLTSPLTSAEVQAIINFVRGGKSLLIANGDESLWQQKTACSINELLKHFGLRVQQLVSSSVRNVVNFQPHYISSGISRLAIGESSYLKTLNDSPQIIATLPYTDEPFLSAVEVGTGRVVAVGDFSLFENHYIGKDNNRELVLNIFHWLTRQNSLDLRDSHIDSHVMYGRQAIFSIDIINPSSEQRLENLKCFLGSDKAASVDKPKLTVRSILTNESIRLHWLVEPRKLGLQSLNLKINFPPESKHSPLFFDHVKQFSCVPEAKFDLIFTSGQKEIIHEVEIGASFWAKAIVYWGYDARQASLSFDLSYPSSCIKVKEIEPGSWHLTALKKGIWKITLTINETNQKFVSLIHVYSSLKSQISVVKCNTVGSLTAKLHYQISQVWQEFDVTKVRDIPFRLLTPETLVDDVYTRHTRERLLEILRILRSKAQKFSSLVYELLLYVAPMYSPKDNCCYIPYDPRLAAFLAEEYPKYEQELAYNLLAIEGDDRYSQTWLEGNIAALLLHEKYGHGFFYRKTKLGKQLRLLSRHGLLNKTDYDELKSPYLISLYEKYERVIRMLAHSALLLNEGFATWVELSGLQNFLPDYNQVFYRRKEFLFQDTELSQIISCSNYFQKFHPGPGSKYEIIYEFLADIQGCFEPNFGAKCALYAMVKAADVDFGITEQDGRIQFGLDADNIEEWLLNDTEDYVAGADRRLRHITTVIEDYSEHIQKSQEYLDKSWCLHSDNPVSKIVHDHLGW